MATKKISKKTGRPLTVIDWKVLDNYLLLGARMIDIEEMMGIGDDAIRRAVKREFKLSFADYRNKKMAKTRLTLIQKALTMAKQGDRTLLIFSLKNLCGWSDKQEISYEEGSKPSLVIDFGKNKNKK